MKAFSVLGKDSIGKYQDFRYLSILFLDACLEVELYRVGRNDGFQSVEEVRDFLEGFQTAEYRNPRMTHTLAESLKSKKRLRYIEDLMLEIALLSAELRDFPNKSNLSVEEMRDFFLNASKVFQKESYDYLPQRLVA